jgi:hypothetical protein
MLRFFVPALIFTYLWYEIISTRGFYAAFTHDDFYFTITGTAPSPFFVLNYLLGALGVFFLAASAMSLLASFVRRKNLEKNLRLLFYLLGNCCRSCSREHVLGAW